jgi:hypothetical protein
MYVAGYTEMIISRDRVGLRMFALCTGINFLVGSRVSVGTLAAQRYPTTDSILLRSYLYKIIYTSIASTHRRQS